MGPVDGLIDIYTLKYHRAPEFPPKIDFRDHKEAKNQFFRGIQGPNGILRSKYVIAHLVDPFYPFRGNSVALICIQVQISDIGQPFKNQGPKIDIKIKRCTFFIFSS